MGLPEVLSGVRGAVRLPAAYTGVWASAHSRSKTNFGANWQDKSNSTSGRHTSIFPVETRRGRIFPARTILYYVGLETCSRAAASACVMYSHRSQYPASRRVSSPHPLHWWMVIRCYLAAHFHNSAPRSHGVSKSKNWGNDGTLRNAARTGEMRFLSIRAYVACAGRPKMGAGGVTIPSAVPTALFREQRRFC